MRTTFDTLQNQSTPPAGHYADLEKKSEQIVAMINEHAAALDRVVDPTGVGLATGVICAPMVDLAVNGGIPYEYSLTIADAADQNYDIVVAFKFEVTSVRCIKSGNGAGNTVTVQNAANPITEAMATTTDKAVTSAATIDLAQNVIPAGGTLRTAVHRAAGSGAVAVIIHGFKRS